MRRIIIPILVLLLSGLPALAQEEPGNLARVAFWSIKAGMEEQFENGLKAHNGWHRQQNDSQALLTWEVVTGPRTGQYLRASFGHRWPDFDQDPKTADADAADSAIHLDPYIESGGPAIYRHIPELSRSAGETMPLARVLVFHLKYGKAREFEAAVMKIHQALGKIDWPHYEWYALVDGGWGPTYVVSLPRANWAGFVPGEKSLPEVVGEAYGDEADGIWEAFEETVASQESYSVTFRSDLSYIPGGE